MQVENASQRRRLISAQVRMPPFAGNIFGIRIRMNGDDLRVPVNPCNGRMDSQRSKQPPQILMGIMADGLVPEKYHLKPGQRIA